MKPQNIRILREVLLETARKSTIWLAHAGPAAGAFSDGFQQGLPCLIIFNAMTKEIICSLETLSRKLRSPCPEPRDRKSNHLPQVEAIEKGEQRVKPRSTSCGRCSLLEVSDDNIRFHHRVWTVWRVRYRPRVVHDDLCNQKIGKQIEKELWKRRMCFVERQGYGCEYLC